MARRPRPSLISLSLPAPGPAAPPGAAEPGQRAEEARSVRLRMNEAGWREVTDLARLRGLPVESLVEEAFNDALIRHRRAPVVRCRRPEEAGTAAGALAVRMMLLGATWPARMGFQVWSESVAAPALAAWAHWAAMAEAGCRGQAGRR